MNDERLIELVRKHSVIYDLSHPKYMDINFKQDIWNNQIGEGMKRNGSVCKARWNNIRNNYMKSLKRMRTKSDKKKIRYKYSEQLSFLTTNFDADETKGNIKIEDIQYHEIKYEATEENTENDTREQNILDMSEYVQSQPSSLPNHQISSPNHQPSSLPNHQLPAFMNAFEMSRKSKKEIKQIAPQQIASPKLAEYIISNKEQATTSLQHPVDAFLAGVAPTLKIFTPYYLHLAKSDIFATVQKYEMKMIMEQQRWSDPKSNHNMTPRSEYVYSSTLS